MVISEFAVHNALRTYSRQEKLGKVQKARSLREDPAEIKDRLALSATGQKVQFINKLASELAEKNDGDPDSEETPSRASKLVDDLMFRHKAEIVNEGITPEDFEALIRPLYRDG